MPDRPATPPLPLTIEAISTAAAALPDAVVTVASEESGAPEPAWGDVFVTVEPPGVEPRGGHAFPFATVVRRDTDGAVSIDGREGVFRFNVGVGRERFTELVGISPTEAAGRIADWDATALDTLLPHPVYATQGWVSILSPGERTAHLALELLAEAYGREARRVGPAR